MAPESMKQAFSIEDGERQGGGRNEPGAHLHP